MTLWCDESVGSPHHRSPSSCPTSPFQVRSSAVIRSSLDSFLLYLCCHLQLFGWFCLCWLVVTLLSLKILFGLSLVPWVSVILGVTPQRQTVGSFFGRQRRCCSSVVGCVSPPSRFIILSYFWIFF